MFTGIIEGVGEIEKIENEATNINLWVKSTFTNELKIDQSVAHNGVCLTVVEIINDLYKVTAIQETLNKTNLGNLSSGDLVNLERCLQFNGRSSTNWKDLFVSLDSYQDDDTVSSWAVPMSLRTVESEAVINVKEL